MLSWSKRMASKVEWHHEQGATPHLIWTGAKNRWGYPYMRNEEGKVELVARSLWRRAMNKTPVRLRNTCGRRDCVAPGHWVES